MDEWSDADIAAFGAKLEALRLELEEVRVKAKGASDIVLLDQQSVGRLSRMDALQNQAMAQETERRRQLDLRKIELAFARIEEGEFGYCAVCGDPIRRARLDIDPAAATCVAHAK
ncbi:MAG: molecular chaperone DnaK [Rhodobiaceae bacterium]|nr:MAG: molecular chaperone DnaK [Rhodobiaceae bacterium]